MLAGLVALAALAYVAFALVHTVSGATVTSAMRSGAFTGRPLRLAWPRQGEAAVGVQGVGLIGFHGSGRATPIASLAKVMTAYLVLADHPLSGGEPGPQITVTPADVVVYRADEAAGQSVVAVRAGERLTERQALEGLLLPSGNNIATLLARWDAGSERAFVAKMNSRAQTLGLLHTRYTDASGVQAGTVSTAVDQVRLAMRAIVLPAFRQTVAMAQATLPVAGRQYNKNALLGKDGIFGVKTAPPRRQEGASCSPPTSGSAGGRSPWWGPCCTNRPAERSQASSPRHSTRPRRCLAARAPS
jgi:serine-type D-Ala-D-Ala carboxypeptidase (penicillin-binding protein 5/6)